MNINQIMSSLEAKHPGESEYLQAVREVLLSIEDIYNQHPEFEKASLIERLVEPDRIITFRVPWVDDKGKVQVNLGYRVQFNNAIGPYKGGIRFHASVNLSILKFLGFEQTFKNALTTLPMGGGKGGSDFSPRGKSDAEVMRFCQAFMLELWRHVGPDMDVPAGDIGVGGREVGYMFGMYKKLTHEFTGTFTGKGLEFGGSLIRPEATGFGGLYFVKHMLDKKGIDIKGKTVAISGFGNVAWGAATKATQLGAKVVTISGPDGYIYDPDGISGEKIDYMLELRASGNDIVAPYADKFSGSTFVEGRRPWEVKVDIALPCATQNELNGEDAMNLINNSVLCVGEISNMGCTPEAIDAFIEHKLMYAVGYMFGMYKKLTHEFTGTFTGKGLEFGGSLIRPEATGFGGLYFVKHMLDKKGIDIKGKTVAISGFGNVAWGAATKATQLGAKVVTISGPDGYIYDPDGISGEKIDYMLELRASGNDIVAPYADKFSGSTFVEGRRPWEVKVDIALPCATQNELNGEDAMNLINNSVLCVGEISNMGCTPEAIDAFIEHKLMYAPGKAVNAGGVATSGLEMSQNAMHLSWTAQEVDEKLHQIMHNIHEQCVKYGTEPDGYINYVKGANIAGFMKVAHAMMAQGIV